ncbi:unnamed protein product [Alopecurus aequalis]
MLVGGVLNSEAAYSGRGEHVGAVMALDETGFLCLVLREGMEAVMHHHRRHRAKLVLVHQLHHAPRDELLEVALPDLLHGAPTPRPHEPLSDPQPHQPRRIHRDALRHRREVEEAGLEVVRQVVECQRHDPPAAIAVLALRLVSRHQQLRHDLVPLHWQLLGTQHTGEDDNGERQATGDPEHVLVVSRLVSSGAVAAAAEHTPPEQLICVFWAEPRQLDRVICRATGVAHHLQPRRVSDQQHPAAVALIRKRGPEAVPVGDSNAAVDHDEVPPAGHVPEQRVADVLALGTGVTAATTFFGDLAMGRGPPELGAGLPVDVAEHVGRPAVRREHGPGAYGEVVADLGALVDLARERGLADAALADDGDKGAAWDGVDVEELLPEHVAVLVETHSVLLQIVPASEFTKLVSCLQLGDSSSFYA